MESENRFTIGKKILLTFSILVIIFIVNAIISLIYLEKSDKIARETNDVIEPSISLFEECARMIEKSKHLTILWYKTEEYTPEKEELSDLYNVEFPRIRSKLINISEQWRSDTLRTELNQVLTDIDTLLNVQKTKVMDRFDTPIHYKDPILQDETPSLIKSDIIPKSDELFERVDYIKERFILKEKSSNQSLYTNTVFLKVSTISLSLLLICLTFVNGLLLNRWFTEPVSYINNMIRRVGEGDLTNENEEIFANDEIGDMGKSMVKFIQNLRETTEFAQKIGKGDYDASYSPMTDRDVLGNALVMMGNNLKTNQKDAERRLWESSGLTLFDDILRTKNNNIEVLAYELIFNMVNLLNANQGSFFIVEGENEEEKVLTLKACYAWDRKRKNVEKIKIGEGLTGQAWQDQEVIYLNSLPDEYIKITSGLGEANPTTVLIVPLVFNKEVFGVMEVASFKEFEQFEIDFFKKAANNIASTVSSVKNNERTEKLLQKSQESTLQMETQEEEMRQNMEELLATQSTVENRLTELEINWKSLASHFGVLSLTTDGEIISVNQPFLDFIEYDDLALIGQHFSKVVEHNFKIKKEYLDIWKTVSMEKPVEIEILFSPNLGDVHSYPCIFLPVKKGDHEVLRINCLVHLPHIKNEEQGQE